LDDLNILRPAGEIASDDDGINLVLLGVIQYRF
jgi:hypothetical protein